MDCERSVITMTLLQLDYLVYGLGNYIDDTPIETGLICAFVGVRDTCIC